MADLRQIRYLLATLRSGSLSAAAIELHVSQSALSESIRNLESELGAELLTRSSRGVSATPAGRALADGGAAAVETFDSALEAARRVARGQLGTLRIGFVAAGAGTLSARARSRFAAENPEIQLEPVRLDWGAEAAALREQVCDVAFVWLPADLEELHSVEVASERRFAGLPARHRLAARESLDIAELDDEPIMWTSAAPRSWVDWWAVDPRPSGRAPRYGPRNANVEEMLEQVATGEGYCIVPRSMTEFYGRPDLAWVPIDGIEPLRIAIAWREDDASSSVARFVALTRELAHRSGS